MKLLLNLTAFALLITAITGCQSAPAEHKPLPPGSGGRGHSPGMANEVGNT